MKVVRHTVSLDGLGVVVFDDSVEITIKLRLSFEGDKREMAFSAEENMIKKMGVGHNLVSRVTHV